MKSYGIAMGLLLWATPAVTAGEQRHADLGECALESGETLRDCQLGYRTFGTPDETRENGVLVPTWFGGTSEEHEYMVGPGFLDPERYFVILVDALGNGVSSSPSNSPTQANQAFPGITIRDMVRTQHRLVTEVLGLERLHAVVGASMGGMQAFQWAVAHPGFARKTVVSIGSPRLPSFDIVRWETYVRLLELHRSCECPEALEALTGLGMLARSPGLVSQEIRSGDVAAVLEERAREQGLTVPGTWDLQRQAEAMIAHDVSRGFEGDLDAAAAVIEGDVLIVVGREDRVVTPEPALSLAERIGAEVLILDNHCGHGEPWCVPDLYAAAIQGFLSTPTR